MPVSGRQAFTIGYGGRAPEQFVSLLKEHGVRLVVDVRLRPDRASMGAFAKAKDPEKGIQGLLTRAGIDYRSIIELGNVFVDDLDHWEERYARLIESSGELLTRRLVEIATGPLALLCAEKRVQDCHRRIIAQWLQVHKGWTFEHIE